MRTLLLKPALDDRGGELIRSRIGLSAQAVNFARGDDLLELVRNRLNEADLHCVLVDEAQFLSRAQVYQLSEVVDRDSIPVLTYGLRTDFQGELFEGSRHLLAWADELNEIKTICHCGSKATMVVRTDESGRPIRSGSQIEIGGNERYVSLCRAHFKDSLQGGESLASALQSNA